MDEPTPNGALPVQGQDIEMKEEEEPAASTVNSQPAPNMTSEAIPPLHSAEVATPPPASSASAARPGSMPPQPVATPAKPVAHGGPTRQYLNQNVTPHLLEAMKHLAAHEPEKPLLWLSEFLRDRSKSVEG